MQSILMAVSAAALLHSTLSTSQPLSPADGPSGPRPQNGVWALLPAKCEAPTTLDLSAWDKCATPVGFLDDEVAALEKPGPGKKATADEFYSIARTRFAMAPGLDKTSPAVAQVVVPMIFSRSYYYIAVAPDALDADGRFAAAKGWPVACLPRDKGGCNPKTLADVQGQAAITPTDPARLYRLVRITAASAPAQPTADPVAPAPATITPPAVTPDAVRVPAAKPAVDPKAVIPAPTPTPTPAPLPPG